jgi:hypothetical protein
VSNSVGLATEPTEILSFFSKNSVLSPGTTPPGLVCGNEKFSPFFGHFQ